MGAPISILSTAVCSQYSSADGAELTDGRAGRWSRRSASPEPAVS